MSKLNTKIQNYWIMKSEPSEFSILDLEAKQESLWDGIRNYQARNMIRDEMQVGDRAFFYHSSCKNVGMVGLMRISGEAVPDPAQFDVNSHYYDAKSTPDKPRWLAIPVCHIKTFKNIISLSTLRTDKDLQGLTILKTGNRLSITKISKEEYTHLMNLMKKVQ